MNQHYELTITLTIRGPFITSSGTDALRGLDLIFARDGQGKLVLRASHVKGKFREAVTALHELNTSGKLPEFDFDIDPYLGKKADKKYRPRRGRLHFHDFALENEPPALQKGQHTRVNIDTQTGTAKESALVTIEEWFKTGSCSVWTGKIDFFACDAHKADAIRQNVLLGFKWITNFGAMKGSGYGRLEQVSASVRPVEPQPVISATASRNEVLTLRFEFCDDLMIGGAVRGANYKESQRVIPGGVIKGALARFLNELCGTDNLAIPVTAGNLTVAARFPVLAHYFPDLRFSHAFPVLAGAQKRPVAIPYSTVKDFAGNPWDLALQGLALRDPQHALLGPDGKSPTYQIDWKDDSDLKARFGWADCQISNATRTAIEAQTRTAQEEQLYTYQYLSPYDKHGNTLPWLATIRLPDEKTIGSEEFAQLYQQLIEALNAGWRYLGKRDTQLQLHVTPGNLTPQIPRHQERYLIENQTTHEQQAIVVLQTDALLFDGHDLAQSPPDDLREVYRKYWESKTEGTCHMTGYLARQIMIGEYFINRFRPYDFYYPYMLTEAGSVFVLQTTEPETAQTHLQRFERDGLELPDAVLKRIEKQSREVWEACPFSPEDGFGEISINLDWFWRYHDYLKEGEEDDHNKS